MLDKQSRTNNILLFNLPEVTTNTVNPINDEITLNNIFKLLELDTHLFHTSRLVFMFCLLLKIDHSRSHYQIAMMFSKCFLTKKKLKSNKSWSNFHFSPDRTEMQRDFISNLCQVLLQRHTNGENDLIIKYFKDTYSILKSKY